MSDTKKIRAVVCIPVAYAGALFSEYDFKEFENIADMRGGFEGRLKVRATFAEQIRWIPGYLKTATPTGIPCAPFNAAIGNDLPAALSRIISMPENLNEDDFWYFRSSTPYFNPALPSGISGIEVEAIEAFQYPVKGSDRDNHNYTVLLLFHLISTDNETNRRAILSLSKIHNKPAQVLFANFFHSPFVDVLSDENVSKGKLVNKGELKRVHDYQRDDAWYFPKHIKTTLLSLAVEDQETEVSFHNMNISVLCSPDDASITRFRTQYAFLTILINIQKEQFDYMRKTWNNLADLSLDGLRGKHAELAFLRSQWWWKRITYEDSLQFGYSSWSENLDFESDIHLYERDISDYLAIATAMKTQEEAESIRTLNNLVKVFAIFGIVPAWIALAPTVFDGWLTFFLGCIALATLLLIPAQKLAALLQKLAKRI